MGLRLRVKSSFGPIHVRTPGHFGPIPFWSSRFEPVHFGPISGVCRFGPVLMGRFGSLYFIQFKQAIKSFISWPDLFCTVLLIIFFLAYPIFLCCK